MPLLGDEFGAVEVIGLPGSGKTTLVEYLRGKSPNVAAVSIYPALRHLDSFLRSAITLSPVLLSAPVTSSWWWKERIWMVRLGACVRVLGREARSAPVLVFDQGPVFTMAQLEGAHPAIGRSDSFKGWWDRMLHIWATRLTTLVVLDAPNEVLMERIQARTKSHDLKVSDEHSAYKTLTRGRNLYEKLIAELSSRGDVCVMRFDSSRLRPDTVSDQVLASLGVVRIGRDTAGSQQGD